MGTRADFYIGRGESAEWLGSIAFDGYPEGIPKTVLGSGRESAFRNAVAKFIAEKDHGITPDMGWPWPWENSATTDFAYAWDNGVHASCFGSPWFNPNIEYDQDYDWPDEDHAVFPEMKS